MVPVNALIFAALFLASTAWGVNALKNHGRRMVSAALTCAVASYIALFLARPLDPYSATGAFLLIDLAIVVLAMHFVMRLLGAFDDGEDPGDDWRRPGTDDEPPAPLPPAGPYARCKRPSQRDRDYAASHGWRRTNAGPRRIGHAHRGRPVRRPSRRHGVPSRPVTPRR
ncbi:MAG: hypothetical protein H7123_10130 [Thermoleophilia bacterium]|nr:hypothetical protein [Thermoleophilia bacterium]